MTTYPRGFVPDLRRLRHWPSLRDSLWRNPDLVRITFGELAGLVQRCIGPQPRRVLYVGSGLGHIALELARSGHDVTGLDVDQESVALARAPRRQTRSATTEELCRTRSPSSGLRSGAWATTIASFSPAFCTTSRTPLPPWARLSNCSDRVGAWSVWSSRMTDWAEPERVGWLGLGCRSRGPAGGPNVLSGRSRRRPTEWLASGRSTTRTRA